MGSTIYRDRVFGSGTPASNKSISLHNYQIVAMVASSITLHDLERNKEIDSIASALNISSRKAKSDLIPWLTRVISIFERSPKMDIIGGGGEGHDTSIRVEGTGAPITKDAMVAEIKRAGVDVPVDVTASGDGVSKITSSVFSYVRHEKIMYANMALGCIFGGTPKQGYMSMSMSEGMDTMSSITAPSVNRTKSTDVESGDENEFPAIGTYTEWVTDATRAGLTYDKKHLLTGYLVNNIKQLKDPEHKIIFDQNHITGVALSEFASSVIGFLLNLACTLPIWFETVLDCIQGESTIINESVNNVGGMVQQVGGVVQSISQTVNTINNNTTPPVDPPVIESKSQGKMRYDEAMTELAKVTETMTNNIKTMLEAEQENFCELPYEGSWLRNESDTTVIADGKPVDYTLASYTNYRCAPYKWVGMSQAELDGQVAADSENSWSKEICDNNLPTGAVVTLISDAKEGGCNTDGLYIGSTEQFYNAGSRSQSVAMLKAMKSLSEEPGSLSAGTYPSGTDYLASSLGLSSYFGSGGILSGACAARSATEIVAELTPAAKIFAADKLNEKADMIEDRIISESGDMINVSDFLTTLTANLGTFSTTSMMSSATPDSGSGPAATGITNSGAINPGGLELYENWKANRTPEYKSVDETIFMNFIFKWCSEIGEVDQLRATATTLLTTSDEQTQMGPAGIMATDLHKYSFSSDWENISEGRTEESVLTTWANIAASVPQE